MPSYGPVYPGTVSQTTQPTSPDWTNPDNAQADDGATADAAHGGGSLSEIPQSSGFDFSAIPDEETPVGILVEIERHRTDGGGNCQEIQVQLAKAGPAFPIGDNKATGTLPTTATLQAYGGAADVWDITWTATEIKEDLSILYRTRDLDQSDTARVDFVRVTVTTADPAAAATTSPVNVALLKYRRGASRRRRARVRR